MLRYLRILLPCAVAAFPLPASTHTHVNPDGTVVEWYPKECCHDRDCRPVATIRAAAHGLWMTTVDGQTVLVGPDDERRPSRDSRWHICLGEDIYGTPVIRCLFQPPNATLAGTELKAPAPPGREDRGAAAR